MRRALLTAVVLAAIVVPTAWPVADAATSYAGTIRFRGAEPSNLGLLLDGKTATVSLGPGHVVSARTAVNRSKGTLSLSVPGLPKPIVLTLEPKGPKLNGTARQGAASATVTLTRGRTSPDAGLGYFSSPAVEVIRFTRFGFSTKPLAVDTMTGAFDSSLPATGARLDVRQYEVRFPNGKTTLAGTLTIPPGAGPHPGVVYVSGSGPTLREESHWLDSLFISRGIAVLAYDKRGIGQSGGVFPGDFAGPSTIDTLAGDAAAAARFLGAQSGIDRSRVGFYGISQAGWIIPQAAVRAGGATSWAVVESGPTVTQGESDNFFAAVQSTTSIAEAERSARQLGASGYDPAPWIRRLAIPVLWLYGGADRNQPTGTSMELLRELSAGHDFTTRLYPSAPHSLFDADGFPAGMFDAATAWLRLHGLVA